MKNTILLIMLLLLLSSCMLNNREETKNYYPVEDSIRIYCTPDLFDLASSWISEFCTVYPNVKINLVNVTESYIDRALFKARNICFISGKYYAALEGESIWRMVVGRDVIVPIINSKNPFLDEIYKQGISSEGFAQFFNNPEMQNWGTLISSDHKASVNFYMLNDESTNSIVANFLNVNQNVLEGIKVASREELISSIQNDPLAIGFCKMTNTLDVANQSILENVMFLPIDRNGNGEIDQIEEIYGDLNSLSRGVWIGKYPKALVSNIYSISSAKPNNEIEVAFLNWVLTGGQELLNSSGYSDLVFSERQAKVNLLYDTKINISPSRDKYAMSKMIGLILLPSVILVFIVMALVRYIWYRKTKVPDANSIFPLVFDEESVIIPKGLFYDKTHTWAFMEKDGMVKIGLDDFLQHITGPLTRVKMKKAGDKIIKGQELLSIIQSGKQLNIYAPISGTIKAQNDLLNTNSSIINSSPYADGWVYMIEPTNWLREIQFLIMEKKYKEWLKSEFSRFKDFLAVCVKPNAVSVLQDGGELKDGVLADLQPEVWEDFQTNFIDTSK